MVQADVFKFSQGVEIIQQLFYIAPAVLRRRIST
jgi:hypothetical protein